jgi:poly(3-hydroxybutyrate) depolymerase
MVEAALRARNILIKSFALEPRKLILVGYSGGGGMVINFVGA